MIKLIRNYTAYLSDPERGPYKQPQPASVIWSGDDVTEAARVYYEAARQDCPGHPSGYAGISTRAEVPAAQREAFSAAVAAQREQREPDRIRARLPDLPPGWDAVIGSQYIPDTIALRSREYRETYYGDVVFLHPGDTQYQAALTAIAKPTGEPVPTVAGKLSPNEG